MDGWSGLALCDGAGGEPMPQGDVTVVVTNPSIDSTIPPYRRYDLNQSNPDFVTGDTL